MKSRFDPNFCLTVLLFGLLLTSAARSEEATPEATDPSLSPLSRTLSFGVAAGIMRFDTNFRFTNRDTGRSVFIDSEGTLGLPENKTIPIVYGYWRPSQRHGLGYGFFSVRRESELIVIDENFGDLNLSGTAVLTDDSKFYGLTYNYTLFQDDRAYLFATLGANVIDLEYRFDARGTISIGGEPVESGEYKESIRQFAPFPTVGIDSWFSLTERWAFGARASFVGGNFGDIEALITEAAIRAKYSVNRNVGFWLGVRYFDAEIEIKRSTRIDEITYGLDGLIIGIDVGF